MSTVDNQPAKLTPSKIAKYLLYSLAGVIHSSVNSMTLAIKGAIAGGLVMTGYFFYSANPETIQLSDFLFMLHTPSFKAALSIGAVAKVLLSLPVVELPRH